MKSLAKKKNRRGQRGFTLVELTVVLAIMGMIAALSVPNLMSEINEKRANITIQDSQAILDAVRAYRLATGSWPGNATCTNAITFLSSTTPPYLGGIGANNKYNSPYSTSCNGLTFTLRQNIAQDWDGVVANGLTGTTITNAATYQISSTIGIPGSEPALDSKLSRINTGNAELNRMRTTLYMAQNTIAEGGDIALSKANPRIIAQNGDLNIDAQGGDVRIASGDVIEVDNIRLRSKGNRLISDLLPNYVHIGTYHVYHGWGIYKPACGSGGSPRASLRPAAWRGGYSAGVTGSGIFGTYWRLVDNGSWWGVNFDVWGTWTERTRMQGLADVYCYYP